MSIANQLKACLPCENQGLQEIEVYQGMKLPEDYEITEVLGDIIMAEFVDCSEDGGLLQRGGIYINTDVTRNTWRVAQVILKGPACSERIQAGKYIMFPNDKGIPAVSKGKRPRIFINEERLFGICEPTK